LVHGSFAKARAGDAEAKGRLREGLGHIHKSIEVNPEAHFGREIWQAVAVEFLLAAIDDPKLLLEYDLAGNKPSAAVFRARALTRPSFGDRSAEVGRRVAAYLRGPATAEEGAQLRGYITPVGPPFPTRAAKGERSPPVPFDEPVLGMIGMWRLGGG